MPRETPFVWIQKSNRSAHVQRLGMATGDFMTILSDFVCSVFFPGQIAFVDEEYLNPKWNRNYLYMHMNVKGRMLFGVRTSSIATRTTKEMEMMMLCGATYKRDNNGSRLAQKERTIVSINTFTEAE